jgi:hypothetical protein
MWRLKISGDFTLDWSVNSSRRFDRSWCHHFQSQAVFFWLYSHSLNIHDKDITTLQIFPIYQTTRRNNPAGVESLKIIHVRGAQVSNKSRNHPKNLGARMTTWNKLHTEDKGKGKGKAIPLQAWTGPEGSRRLRLPDFNTIGTWRC